MSGENVDQRSFPVERYPDPVCHYAVEAGTPVVRDANSAFETVFDTGRVGQALPAVFDALGVTADVDDLAGALAGDESFAVSVPGESGGPVARRYRVQVVPPADGDCGVLVFTETDDGTLGVDHVASVVSHDLRNPLDVAKARLRAARDFGEEEHFEHVEQAHERMERIIQDVLTLARGEDVVDPDDAVDLGTVAESAWETVETNGTSLAVEGTLPTAVADPDRIGRLFENLFRNSVEHGSTGNRPEADGQSEAGVTVTVGRLEDGFYVADDGTGIPESDRDRVFQPGYSSDEHGTGLGLAIVARIADLHGWSVTATESEVGGARIEMHDVDPAE